MQPIFGCGIKKNNRREVSFRINSVEKLTKWIIPHFLNDSLLSQKRADFLLFKENLNSIYNKNHLLQKKCLTKFKLRDYPLSYSEKQKSKFI